jgi:hypothetical protein
MNSQKSISTILHKWGSGTSSYFEKPSPATTSATTSRSCA